MWAKLLTLDLTMDIQAFQMPNWWVYFLKAQGSYLPFRVSAYTLFLFWVEKKCFDIEGELSYLHACI